MRIFNGTKKALTLPYTGGETLTIPAHQPSGNVLCSPEFLSSVITAYNADEIAVIASGPFEISACANIPTAVNYVVQSLDEAIARFNPDAKKIQEEEKKKAADEYRQSTEAEYQAKRDEIDGEYLNAILNKNGQFQIVQRDATLVLAGTEAGEVKTALKENRCSV